jgi:hypothetical protein
MGNTYSILPDIGLIIEIYEGVFNREMLFNMKEIIHKDENYIPKMKILADLRGVRILPDRTEVITNLQELVIVMKDNIGRVALLTETPEQTAGAQLFAFGVELGEEHIGVYTTLSASLKHLDVDPKDYKTIENELHKLSGRNDREF